MVFEWITTYKDIKGENFNNGVISIANPDKEGDVKFIEKYGNTKTY